MALTNVTLEASEFHHRVIGTTAAHVDLDGTWLIAYEPEHLEMLVDTLMEAARDLRLSRLALDEKANAA